VALSPAAYSSCMRIESGKVEGDLVLSEDLELRGLVTGDVRLQQGIFFALVGLVGGSVIVESGATAIIRGTVSKDVVNKGGTIEIYGSVGRSVRTASGNTVVANGAMIAGLRRV
jgi:cytoskeletal protein CcmA (bactofilin family)